MRPAGIFAALVLTLALLPLGAAEVALALLGLHYHRRWPRWGRGAFLTFLGSCGIFHGARQVTTLRGNLTLGSVPEWDFLGFWLHARTAMLGQNFYDPAHARTLALPYSVSPEFMREIVDAGFWYPPPLMFLFRPLGSFDPMAALPWWYAFHGAMLALAVVLLRKTFFPAGGAAGWLACAAFALAIHGTETTFRFSQTNFVALVAVLLLWRARRTARGGAWAAAAFFVKPFLAVLLFPPLLARRWRVLAGALVATAALMVAAAVAFGPDTTLAYFTRDQAGTKPYWIYDQPTNQSLLGMILRFTRVECAGAGCVTHPWFLACASAIGLITIVLGSRLQKAGEEEWALSLLLLLGLIVYPVSQLFYSVLLLPPALLAWRERERVPGGAWGVAAVIGLVFGLASVDDGGASGFAYLLLWAAMVAAGIGLTRRAPEPAAGA